LLAKERQSAPTYIEQDLLQGMKIVVLGEAARCTARSRDLWLNSSGYQ
jgi:hypothetical protein